MNEVCQRTYFFAAVYSGEEKIEMHIEIMHL